MRTAVILIALFAPILAFVHWPAPNVGAAPIAAQEFGTKSGASLVLVEPFLTASDYRSAASLHDALSSYLDEALSRGWIGDRTIIIFPEHVGTWLAAASAPPLAYRANTARLGLLALIADDPIGIGRAFVRTNERDRLSAALFRARGEAMVLDYAEIFSTIAREYGATVVAGSIVLENPTLENGEITLRNGALQNVSIVFGPDGDIRPPLIVKRYPIPDEASFIAGGTEPLPVFDTPAGRLGVLICADAWHPDLYRELSDQGVDIVVTPAFLLGDGAWNHPWGGYVTPSPGDVDEADAGRLTEGEAWQTYSLPGRIRATQARVGATVFLHGNLWDLGADGRTLVLNGDRLSIGDKRPAGAVSVVWF